MYMYMYILGLVFGVTAGLHCVITAAFSFMLSWSSPVYLVCEALVEVITCLHVGTQGADEGQSAQTAIHCLPGLLCTQLIFLCIHCNI